MVEKPGKLSHRVSFVASDLASMVCEATMELITEFREADVLQAPKKLEASSYSCVSDDFHLHRPICCRLLPPSPPSPNEARRP